MYMRPNPIWFKNELWLLWHYGYHIDIVIVFYAEGPDHYTLK